jgi:hypothetical protein
MYLLLVYSDDVNELGENINTIRKKLLCSSKKGGLEAYVCHQNVEETETEIADKPLKCLLMTATT